METWPSPSIFPSLQQSLAAESTAIAIRSKIESGLLGQRRRFPGQITFVSVAWEMTDAVLGTFLVFHKFRLNLGSDWFKMDLPFDGNMVEMVVRFFEGKFQIRYVPVGYWLVTAKLDLKERVTMDEATLDILLGNYIVTDEIIVPVTADDSQLLLYAE